MNRIDEEQETFRKQESERLKSSPFFSRNLTFQKGQSEQDSRQMIIADESSKKSIFVRFNEKNIEHNDLSNSMKIFEQYSSTEPGTQPLATERTFIAQDKKLLSKFNGDGNNT